MKLRMDVFSLLMIMTQDIRLLKCRMINIE